MVFPRTLCDDISSSDFGATDKASFSFSFSFLCLATAITGLAFIFLVVAVAFPWPCILEFSDSNDIHIHILAISCGQFCVVIGDLINRVADMCIDPGETNGVTSQIGLDLRS
ncbi:hypothetical protein AVEN_63548-1 [Araneus ventricosus]|uniref:Uncharacterized protein n=1 Tax=Araneus ventricosus TaxID=182803 RepID=A0A4Y2MPC5_ARAVE|nr:hypothetical protein AVEN_63548-1 [Araneus ventricosus]